MKKHIRPLAALLAAAVLPSALHARLTLTQPADAFIDSVGVNIHLTYTDTAYNRFDTLVKPKLSQLGIRHVRDTVNAATIPAFQAQRINTLRNELGIRSTLAVQNAACIPSMLSSVGPALAAVEGPNEPDLIGAGSYTDAQLISIQSQLYTQTKAHNPAITVLPPSFTQRATFVRFGTTHNIAAHLDAGNIHPYPGPLRVDQNLAPATINAERVSRGSKPVHVTETGYYTLPDGQAGVSLAAHAKYMPRIYLEYFRRGIPRTFAYELLDEYSATNPFIQGGPESHYGLVQLSGPGESATATDKPGFLAVKAMLALLRDDQAAGYRQDAIDYTLSGANADVRHLLLRKGDGTHWLVLWQNVLNYNVGSWSDLNAPAQTITLNFAKTFSSLQVYEPKPANGFSSTQVVQSAASTSAIQLSLGDYPLYCKINIAPTLPITAATATVDAARQGAGDGMLIAYGSPLQVEDVAHNYPDSRVGDENATTGYRSVFKFSLPPAPAGKRVASARYTLRYLGKYGAPTHDLVAIEHTPAAAYPESADWSAAGASLGILLTPASAPGDYFIQNTTTRDRLRAAYRDGRSTVSLRLQLSGNAVATGGSGPDFYTIATTRHATAAWRPALLIQWENDPQAVTLTASVAQPAHNGTIVANAPFTAGSAVWPSYADSRIGDENTSVGYRTVQRFTLPALPSGHHVQSATLKLRRLAGGGSVTHPLHSWGFNTSPVNITAADWNRPAAAAPLGLVATPGSGQGEIAIPVTDALRKAYAAGAGAFGLHLALHGTAATTGGSSYDFYGFATSLHGTPAYRPVVEIISAP